MLESQTTPFLKQLAIEQSQLQLWRYLLFGIVLTVELAEIDMLAPLCVAPHRSKHTHRVDVESTGNFSVRHLLLLSELHDLFDVDRTDLFVVPPAFGLLFGLSLLRRRTHLFETLVQRSKILAQRPSIFGQLEIQGSLPFPGHHHALTTF